MSCIILPAGRYVTDGDLSAAISGTIIRTEKLGLLSLSASWTYTATPVGYFLVETTDDSRADEDAQRGTSTAQWYTRKIGWGDIDGSGFVVNDGTIVPTAAGTFKLAIKTPGAYTRLRWVSTSGGSGALLQMWRSGKEDPSDGVTVPWVQRDFITNGDLSADFTSGSIYCEGLYELLIKLTADGSGTAVNGTFYVQGSDDGTDWWNIALDKVLGAVGATAATFTHTDGNENIAINSSSAAIVISVTLVGLPKYVRVFFDFTGGTTNQLQGSWLGKVDV